MATPSVRERLLSKLVPSGECLEWIGYRNPKGYGRTSVSGRMVLTHRLAWSLANGPVPDGMSVLHRCDNPQCCRVDHLFLGTNADNVADKVAKGRCARGAAISSRLTPEMMRRAGTANGNSKLTDDSVREIRRRLADGIETKASIARAFGVSNSAIGFIVNGTHWKHVI